MEELRYRPVAEVEAQGKFVKNIGFKPTAAPYACLAFGVALLFVSNLLVRFLGVFFILMSVAVFTLVKDFKVLEVYSEGVMLYGDREGKYAYFLKYDDMKSWTVLKDDGHDVLQFTLYGGNRIQKTTFQAYAGFRAINEIVPEKEDGYIKKMETRKQPLDWKASLEAMREKFMKKK